MEPINGKEYFFTEETFLRVAGYSSFVDWVDSCLTERGYACDIATNPQQRSHRDQIKEGGKSGRGFDKKDRPAHHLDKISRLKCLQKTSNLTHGQQKRYLDLFQKYILTVFQKQPTPTEIKELTELEVKVSAEQSDFLKCLESIAKTSNAEYNFLLPDAKKYIEEKLQNWRSTVNQYPKHYSPVDVIPIKKTVTGQVYDLVFQKTVLQMGPDPKVFLPDMKASMKPIIPTSYEKIVKRFPSKHVNKDENIWNHEPCSKDKNAEILASKYFCDVTMSCSVLQCLVDNHSPNYERDWQIPVVVKQTSSDHTSDDSDSKQKVVYLDKPLCPKVLSNRQKNTMYHKYALKAFITHSAQNKSVKTLQGKLASRGDVKVSAVSNHSRTGSIAQHPESENLFETETTIDDLETFGSFDKISVGKQKSLTENILGVNIPSKQTTMPVFNSENNGYERDFKQKCDGSKLADSKAEKHSGSDCITDAGKTVKQSSGGTSVEDVCTDIRVKKSKRPKLKLDDLKSDLDSDEENMLIIDCVETENYAKELSHSITPTSSVMASAKTITSEVSGGSAVGRNDGHSKGFVEFCDSPMSPDNSSDVSSRKISPRTKSTSLKDGNGDNIACNIKLSESNSQNSFSGSMKHMQTDLQQKKSIIVPLLRCDQDSPMSPEKTSDLYKSNISCSGRNSVRGHDIAESPMSPDGSTKTSPKLRRHSKQHESESDSHDDSLVIASDAENSQVFLSPRALRARKRYNSSDTLSRSQTEMSKNMQSVSLDSEVAENVEKSVFTHSEDKSISKADTSSSDEVQSLSTGSDVTGVRRKRGRPRKEKPEDSCKKFKSPTAQDLPDKVSVKEEVSRPECPKPTDKEPQRKATCKHTGASPLESILQLQNKMLPSTPGHHDKLLDGESNNEQYKQPDDMKILYNLWDFNGLKVLTRASSHGTLREYPNKLYPVTVVPKLEYQSKFGVEQITQSEMCRNWASCLVKPNTHLIRGRINAQTSEIIMLEDLDISKVLQPSIPFSPQEFFCFLHGLFLHLKRLPVGNYLLSHSKGESYINILNSIEAHKRGSYDLHFDHKVLMSTDSPNASVPWIPIDPTVILPFHKKHGRVPATFEPKDFRKVQKKNKGKVKK